MSERREKREEIERRERERKARGERTVSICAFWDELFALVQTTKPQT